MTNAEFLRGFADAEPRLSRGDVSLMKEAADEIKRLHALIKKGIWGEHRELYGGWRIGQMQAKEIHDIEAAEAGGK